jgi:tetratricopeptide (TPR) repeat protein
VTSKSAKAVANFEAGLDLLENIREAEAIAKFQSAIEADPDFALAHAYLGMTTPGAEGMAELDRAVALSTSLPEAERLLIESMAAERRGEEARAFELAQRIVEIAPDDWRAHFRLGQKLNERYRLAEAAAELETATRLEPKAGAAYNLLGYARLGEGKTEEAIAAFTKYAEVSPGEPNPHDSLAEALMAAGRHGEAEDAFAKALAVSPAFFPAWMGIAQSRGLRGDWAGCREALAKAKDAATRSVDKAAVDVVIAWSWASEGKAQEAMAALDAHEASTAAQGLTVTNAYVPVDRARMLVADGKPAQALAVLQDAQTRAASAGLPGADVRRIRRQALEVRVEAQAALGRVEDARATLAEIEAEAAEAPGDARRRSMVSFARGEASMAAKQPAEAAAHFAECIPEDSYCHLEEARARAAAGDAAGARQALADILAFLRRDPSYLWVHARAKGMSEASG